MAEVRAEMVANVWKVVAKEGEYVTLRLGSTEVRLVHGMCLATIGIVGNAELAELPAWCRAGQRKARCERGTARRTSRDSRSASLAADSATWRAAACASGDPSYPTPIVSRSLACSA